MPLAATEIILTARPASGGTAAIRTAKANGDWIDEWIMTGDWEVFRPSPSRQYLLGGNGSTSGVLIRQNDRAVIWQGSLFEAAFAPDDQHMIVSPNNSSNALTIVEMAGGRSTSVKQSMLPAAFTASSSNLLSVKGAVNTGAVVSIRRSDNSGQSLFWVTWDGAIRPFDATLPSGVDEYVSSANYGDTRLAWWRNSHVSSSSIDAALLGLFELDLASMTNQALTNLNNTNADCYDPTVDTYYKLSGSTLLSCSCNTGSCISLVSPPAPNETAWAPVVTLSPQRGIVGYNYDWQKLLALLTLCPLVLTGCPRDQSEDLTLAEASQALDETTVESQGQGLASDTIEIATHFTIGQASENAAQEVSDFVTSQLPCASVTVTSNTVTINYSANGSTCTYHGHVITGTSTVSIEKNDSGDVVVDHQWTALSDGLVQLDGTANVTWSQADQTRHVVHDVVIERLRDQKTMDSTGDRRQSALNGDVATGIVVNGSRSWASASGTWALSINNVQMRWSDRVPHAGSYSLVTARAKTLTLSFARRDSDMISVTLAGANKSFTFDVNSNGDAASAP